MSNYSRRTTEVRKADRMKALFALFAVVIMVLSTVAIFGGSSAADESSGSSSSVHSITYYEDETSLQNDTNGVTVKYDGIASTEYNPAYSDVFKNSGWSKLTETTDVSITSRTVTDYTIHVTVPMSEGTTLDLSDWGDDNTTIYADSVSIYVQSGWNYTSYKSEPTVDDNAKTITYPRASHQSYYGGYRYYSGSETATATVRLC